MKYKARRRLQILRDYILGWTVAFVFLCIFRGVGTQEIGALQFDVITSLLLSLSLGPVFGAISGVAQIISEEKIYRYFPMRKLLFFRFVYMVAFISLMIVTTYICMGFFIDLPVTLLEYAFDGAASIVIYVYVVVVEVTMTVISQVNLMLGKNKLSQFLLGRFYTPHEENRVFMFLDLQGSTEHAERLGHIKYSNLIQDCFNDLAVVVENDAEIYQYVGDEAVLTWDINSGVRNNNCVNAYFNFKSKLESRSNYYQSKYDCLPFFKAGINAGKVTVAEVGKIKREIAYHGDAINTAARIQTKCNELNKELLMSESIYNQLDTKQLLTEKIGTIALKGKEEQVDLISVGVA